MTYPIIKLYYHLTKPGIIYGNVLTAVTGFFLASRWHIHWLVLVSLVTGSGLIIASGCVFNNYLDREIDKKMERTQKRAIVTGKVSSRKALLYATTLGLIGFAALLHTNWLTMAIGAVGIFTYVVVYGIAKRRTPYGTLIGTIPGAASLMAGYSAVRGHIDAGSVILVLIMVAWQMSHFYAIAIYRLNDYKAAGLPVWPAKKGILSTKRFIIAYISLFILAVILLAIFGYTGYILAIVLALAGLYWLQLALKGLHTPNDRQWARQTFLFSLVMLLSLSILLPLGTLLP